jgi:hypothetical protein
MTASDFRRLALRLPGAEQQAHMGHPDFRVDGRIFATLNYPAAGWGMIKLTPAHQELFVQAEPTAFVPVKGAWGRQGCTNVKLRAAKTRIVREALQLAWQAATSRPATRGKKSRPSRTRPDGAA